MMILFLILAALPLASAGGTNASCTVDGKTYQHLEKFKIEASGDCIEYLCQNGGYAASKVECKYLDGKCKPLNSTETYTDCITRRCEKRDGLISFYTISEACPFNGTCINVDDSVEQNCVKRTCRSNNGSVQLEYELQCIHEGNCVPLGYIKSYNSGCTKEVCDNRAEGLGFYLQSHDCVHNGACVAVGAKVQNGCHTQQCQAQANNGVQLVYTAFGCQDTDGQCRDIGYVKNGSNHCIQSTCENRDGYIGFYNSKLGCIRNNECYDVGASFTDGCQTKTCKYEGGSLFLETTGPACDNGDGSCSPQGTVKTDGCAEYTCEVRGNSVGYFLTKEECSFKGNCLAINATVTDDSCAIYKCTKEGNTLTTRVDTIQCKDGDTCVPLGSTRVVDCDIQTCEDRSPDFGFYTTEIRCEDIDGTCHSEGEEKAVGADCISWTCQVYPDGSHGYTPMGTHCPYNGECVELGTSVTEDTCFTKTCVSKGFYSQMIFTKFQCKDDNGQCRDQGHIQSYGNGGCIKHECQNRDGYIGYYSISEECFDGTQCQPVGHVRQQGACLTLTCEKRNGNIGYYPGEQKCQDTDGSCKPLGTTRSFNNGCVVQTCQVTSAGLGFHTTKKECDSGNGDGSCVAIGASIEQDCSTKQCKEEGNTLILRTIAMECKAENGDCKTPVTDRFPYRFEDGQLYDNCTCTVDVPNISRKYKCD